VAGGGGGGGTAIEVIPFPSATNVPVTVGGARRYFIFWYLIVQLQEDSWRINLVLVIRGNCKRQRWSRLRRNS
jgi:hypothetical protein